MSEAGEQAADARELAARPGGAFGVGEPHDHISLTVLPADEVAHRMAHGTSIRDASHVHDDDEIPALVRPYLTPAEDHATVMRFHQAALLRPFAALVGALVLAAVTNALLYFHHAHGPGAVDLFHALWIGFAAVAVWYAWKAAQWYQTLLVITPRRMMRISGWPWRKVDSLPWKRCRDLELMRPALGALLGYGTLIAPSLATGHALGVVTCVPRPELVYRMIWGMLEPVKGKSPVPDEVE